MSSVCCAIVEVNLIPTSIGTLKRHATKKPNIIVYDTQSIAALLFNGNHQSHFYDRSMSRHEVLRIHGAIALLQNLQCSCDMWTMMDTEKHENTPCESRQRSPLSSLPIFLLSQVPRRLPWPNTAHNETLWQNFWISEGNKGHLGALAFTSEFIDFLCQVWPAAARNTVQGMVLMLQAMTTLDRFFIASK